jgi:hypothetical protein
LHGNGLCARISYGRYNRIGFRSMAVIGKME